MAGITLAALGIPEVMGYTKIIGTPVITGLYTLLLPVLVFAILGSSRHLVVAADSATAAMISAALASYTGGAQYVALTSLVALAAGGLLLMARGLRLGFLADFLSRTVLVGFLTGVGAQVAFAELHGVLGLENGGEGFWGHLFFTAKHLQDIDPATVCIALCVLGTIVGFERFAPRFPGALLAVVAMIAASAMFHWGNHGIKLVGDVPNGLPHIGLPNVAWNDVPLVLPIAFSCCIVILAQSAATSRVYAFRYGERFSEDTDLVGLSVANLAAGLSGTFVVNGSPTKTAMVDTAGGRSQIAHLTTAATVLLVLLFLTKPLSFLPGAVLAAIVFMIGVKLIKLRELAEIRKKSWNEYVVALAIAAIVLFIGVKEGIMAAMVLSLLDHVRQGYRPHTAIVLTDPVEHWRMAPVVPGQMIEPGLVMYWFGAELYYANANYFSEQALRLVADSPSPVRWLVVDAGAIADIDYSAGKTLKELQRECAKRGVALVLTRVSESLRADLDRQQLTDAIGVNRIFGSRRDCLAAYQVFEVERTAETETNPAGGDPH
ncbi:MAG: SulP family inorganic anion transporter [Thermoguttaceae bacterium]